MADQPTGPWIDVYRETDINGTYYVVKLKSVPIGWNLSGSGKTLAEALDSLASDLGEAEAHSPGTLEREIKERI